MEVLIVPAILAFVISIFIYRVLGKQWFVGVFALSFILLLGLAVVALFDIVPDETMERPTGFFLGMLIVWLISNPKEGM